MSDSVEESSVEESSGAESSGAESSAEPSDAPAAYTQGGGGDFLGEPLVFIVGSQRSGTTILEQLLARHDAVEHWYEPYFVWDYTLGHGEDDHRSAAQATPEVIRFLREEFYRFWRASGAQLIVEKSPEHCFRIPFVERVFPKARWIHIYRDGRDATLSIQREWATRASLVEERSLSRFFALTRLTLARQPRLRNKLQLLRHELRGRLSMRRGGLFNKAKWGGAVGWGPRFKGWQEALEEGPLLRFNALQWAHAVEAACAGLAEVPEERQLSLSYEALLAEPEETLRGVLRFLGVDEGPAATLGEGLRRDNHGKWRSAYSAEELKIIEAALGERLGALGYALSSASAE